MLTNQNFLMTRNDIHQVRKTITGIMIIFNSSNFILLLTTFLFVNDGTPFTRRGRESSPLAIEMYKKVMDHCTMGKMAC